MLLRFTLSNDILGSHIITDPIGWDEIKLVLTRDNEYHSVVESVELPLTFFRSNDDVDGGYDFITNVEQNQGIDAEIGILIEASEDQGDTYETFFEGLLELSTIKDISDAESYKIECNIVRTSFWSKFFSRKSQKVNLSDSVSLDGDSITPVDDINLFLPSQKLRLIYDGFNDDGQAVYQTELSTSGYVQFDMAFDVSSEIKTKYSIGTWGNPELPSSLFDIVEAGDYEFDIRIEMSSKAESGGAIPACAGAIVTDSTDGMASGTNIDVYLQINNDDPIQLTETNVPGLSTVYTYQGTLSIQANSQIRLYGDITALPSFTDTVYYLLVWGRNNTIPVLRGNFSFNGVSCDLDSTDLELTNYGSAPSGSTNPTYMTILANTVTPSTQTDAYLLRDAAESVLSKVISRDNVMFSNYLGDETPTACGANFAIMKGLHVRGYSIADKPLFMSFDDWWDGANPIFNLGLGYETINGTDYIRIEEKGHFYNETPIMTFNNVDKIVRTYDKDKIFKSIEIGYEKWSAESASGVDDPQTKHTYNTRFKVIGKDEKILSKFFAASLGIEQTRRNRVDQGKDWRLDEDIIIIELNRDSSPYQPALDENFSNVNNLLNSSTRYNIGLTVARNFERWKSFFNGCLQTYVNSIPCEYYKFSSGEGNYRTETTGTESCNEGTLAEDQDICVTSDYYHGPGEYEFEVDLSFEEYRTLNDNRKNAIEVSNTDTNHRTCFINNMEYDHYNALAKFNVWIK